MTLVNIQGQNIDATNHNKVGNKQNNKIWNNLGMIVLNIVILIKLHENSFTG